jgi:hypothetical protein
MSEHITDHVFSPIIGHADDDECTFRADGTDATYCGAPLLRHELNEYGVSIHDEDAWLADPAQNY